MIKRVLVWQWGRRGGGPRFGLNLAQAIDRLPGREVLLCLSRRAEILTAPGFPRHAMTVWQVETYGNLSGLLLRLLGAPVVIPRLLKVLRLWRPDLAICAMAGPVDLLMASALRCAGVPLVVIVHDALPHPGDGFPFQHTLQNILIRQAQGVVALTHHVASQLREQAGMQEREIVVASLPPFDYPAMQGRAIPPVIRPPGPMRLLMFGRLLAYKGLDLLLETLKGLSPVSDYECRIVGSGPDSDVLRKLAALPRVSVENRWVEEEEIASVIGWADVMVLPYREASQSGVGAVAVAAGKQVLATRVGGLEEQFAGLPGVTLCDVDVRALTDALEALILAGPTVSEGRTGQTDILWETMAATMLSDVEHLRHNQETSQEEIVVVPSS
ncbi:glycosyltransferase family 4 protein [Acetobacter sp.]|jgi:glycosyltransferase involved in cell wall biosynthesis|uniref:glycosyltransferase family 4 protein n=1 Tax=Acetobacter sp. TaxID=440 RepID=UPI0025C2BE9C|nr:glycosyltransferase family 4 protein [Acetobacter sp.]MCH4091615.1 glycosyltransferase family 4 protein [Acetobacter sp.]MCI1301179.1 glycosyltransferase family 4 protein [Acetobacter sp.]MCI1317417.1 glycosyltransferase family 4 protein [Acetobacter sp.]